jgi:DNA-binding NtrC family response regulator
MMKNDKRILLADDEKIILKVLEEELNLAGYEVHTANNGNEAINKLKNHQYDLVILDNKMPKTNGMEVLKFIHDQGIKSIVIMMTAYGTIDNAVEAMKMGVFDYITKPFESDEMLMKIQNALCSKETNHVSYNNNPLISELLLGKSQIMIRIKETIEKVKNINTTILVTGESGTGKGIVAKEIHYKGNRHSKPFVHINCAVLPSNLIESELFGHVKGAFTGAIEEKKGKFQMAEDGTIFLDEISLLDQALQAKLLTVLQERKFEKIGSNNTEALRARIIAATNENIEQAVKKGNFRKDLYYRLNVITIDCPPLRLRRDDIEILTWHFIAKYNLLHNKSITSVDSDLFDVFKSYEWPGNIRELENFIEKAVAMTTGNVIGIDELASNFTHDYKDLIKNPHISELSLENHELNAILEALERHNGHREKTAETLGISRRTLQYKLKKYNIK